jgi:Domain of unknown function (DUF4226)
MAEQAGNTGAAIQARLAALSARYDTAADADRVLADALAAAHAATVDSVNRLDAITAEIDRAVQNQAALAIDTGMGALEFQKFLIARQREIITVVSRAHDLDSVKKAALEALRSHYAVSAGWRSRS